VPVLSRDSATGR